VIARVPEQRVIDHWLVCEGYDPTSMCESERFDALLDVKPGAAAFLWRERPVDWYRTRIDWTSFRRLRPIRGPGQLHWRQLSTDGTIVGVAEKLLAGGEPNDGVSRGTIDWYRDRIARGDSVPPLIVRTARGAAPWHVVDGNHRATALACHALETGSYEPQSAYVGIAGRPALRSALDRLRGFLQRLRGDPIGRR
jgi:hypothetical protein